MEIRHPARSPCRLLPAECRAADSAIGFTCALLLGVVPEMTGCASIQIASPHNGVPQVIGWARTEEVCIAQGRAVRLRSPGLSLRVHGLDPGVTLGWHETLFFFATLTNGSAEPAVAVRSRNYGAGIVSYGFMAGADCRFAIVKPPEGASVIQWIDCDPNAISSTVVKRDVHP